MQDRDSSEPPLPVSTLLDSLSYINMADDDAPAIDFVSLGMFILDDIEFLPPKPPVRDVIGGAGAYSVMGARIMSPPPLSTSVGWIVDEGSDFPAQVRQTIESWETHCLFRQTPDRLTTRGWNGYGENEHRTFKYLTPKLRIHHDSLDDNLLASKSYHLICSPSRAIDLAENILRRRKDLSAQSGRSLASPLFIWEPVPDLCTPEELETCLQALRHVHVVSPNHGELGAFYGRSTTQANGDVDKEAVQDCCDKWLASGIGDHGSGAVVVRAGKDGCYVASRSIRLWLPAYHRDSSKVVDPTGGGNGFLGGLAVGLVRGGASSGVQNLEEAAVWGNVAASFCIEQVGMPQLQPRERWNGDRVEDRVKRYREMLEAV
ncbi:Ribokinase-like protein [Phyllosticta paracitricarpa]|uniref:Ribokinase-like protein n=2 Tax=Phyllosticta TaxID=121621 RepID=A0ABR1NAV0_9PEZI